MGLSQFSRIEQKYPKVTFVSSISPKLPNICCSPVYVEKCLTNLLLNRAESLQGQGTITLATEIQGQGTPLASGICSNINIHDDYAEIDACHLEHLFEPFYTKKAMGKKGSGLEPAMVGNILLVHGGTVKVVSKNEGTTFELTFPSADDDTDERK